MLSFLLRRILQMVPTILAVAFLIFVLFSVIPGTFASSMSDDGRNPMDPAVLERMTKELGLNDPVHIRFGNYLAKLAQLDLGTSFQDGQQSARTRHAALIIQALIQSRPWSN